MTSNNENNSTMPDTDTPSYARMTATYSPEDNKLRLSSLTRLDKETYNRVKAAGFKWAPRQEIFVAPMWAPDREDLLIELCGEIGDEDTSLMERQEQRAERFEEYSDNRKADAEAAHKAVHAIADGIPLGQPILVGHHSEKHARKDAERIENGMRKAVKMWETSTYWTQRAASAIRHAKYKELPAVRARRIKGLEADIRVYRAKSRPTQSSRRFCSNVGTIQPTRPKSRTYGAPHAEAAAVLGFLSQPCQHWKSITADGFSTARTGWNTNAPCSTSREPPTC